MRQARYWKMGVQATMAAALMGTTFQAGCLGKVARNVNPCGTVLACDPLEYDLLFTEYPDWDLDPTCTIPGFCGGPFPWNSGGGGGGVTVVDPGTNTGFGGNNTGFGTNTGNTTGLNNNTGFGGFGGF
ncbi:MAG: hypothetical protein AMXMBFR13_40050 [Phycisphaerae bacterium]